MPLYKFYRIVPKDATKTDCYIGHTVQPLRKRFRAHCQMSNRCSSITLFRNYGKEALQIVLIHELELPDKEYARREERRLWEEVKEQAVNRARPWVNDEENTQVVNQWYQDNRQAHLSRQKQWREANKEKKATLDKQYREANKERKAMLDKRWVEANKDRVTENKRQWYARESALKYLRILLEQ